MKHMRYLLLLFSTCCQAISAVYAAPPTRLNISQAIEQHIITVQAVATGNSYNKQGLKIKVKNNGSLTFLLIMNQGVIFTPDSAGYQPLMLAGEETLLMNPLKESEVNVQTFCADSRLKAPLKGLDYTYKTKSGDTLVKILAYIKQYRIFNDVGQSAVWVFTNGHELNSIYDNGNEFVSKKLVEYIVAVTGRKMPEYYVQSATSTTPGAEVYNPKTLKIYAQFEEQLESPKTLTLGIYNEQGAMIQPVFENRIHGRAMHRFRVEFEAKNVPAGKYYIRLKEADAVLRETMVEVK